MTRLIILPIILSSLISGYCYSQDTFSTRFLIGKWTVEWGEKYFAPKAEGQGPCDTTDCKGEWNYEFRKDGTLRFWVDDKDSIYTGRWAIKNSTLYCYFDTVDRSFTLTRLSHTRLEAPYRWVNEKTNAQSVAYLHFRRN